jgi:hypothetical protein
MDGNKIGLTVYRLKDGQVENLQKRLFSPGQEIIPLLAPLRGEFLPMAPAKDTAPEWVLAVGRIIEREPSTDVQSKSLPGCSWCDAPLRHSR